MADTPLTVERAEGSQLDYVEDLLSANDLPSRDVRSGTGQFFVALAAGTRVGCGGVELYDSNGLLRSVVVTEPHRGGGYGTALCNALEEHARSNGVETLYLLTTTAAAFFRRQGYEATERDRVPASIRETEQFSDLCPQSATCLRKHLR